MTQEEKSLLLKDLCSRLLYGFFVHRYSDNADIRIDNIGAFGHFLEYSEGEDFKPYLRPMSSMTEEEKEELKKLCEEDLSEFAGFIKNGHGLSHDGLYMFDKLRQLEFCLSHHLDFRGLIEKGLALEAPEGMYETEKQ